MCSGITRGRVLNRELYAERGLDDQDFNCIAEASTWTFQNCTDEG